MSGTSQKRSRQQLLRIPERRSLRRLASHSNLTSLYRPDRVATRWQGLLGAPIHQEESDSDTSESSEGPPEDNDIQEPVIPAQVPLVGIMAQGPHIKIPTFAGQPGENGSAWLKRYTSQCHHLYNYDDGKVNATFPYYLTGQAEAWYNSLSAEVQNNADDLVDQFESRFDGSDCKLSYGTIRQQPHECVADYTTRFLKATNNRNMPVEWLVTSYIDGLARKIRTIVKPQKLDTLEEARQAAMRAEHAVTDHVDVSIVTQGEPSSDKMDQLLSMMSTLCSTLASQRAEQPTRGPDQQPPQTYTRTKDGLLLRSTLLVLLLCIAMPDPTSANDLLPRLNYGVVFQKQSSLTLSREYWLHTFEIKLPKNLNFPTIEPCHNDKDTCKLVSHILAQLNSIRIETGARLNNTLETINKIVPHSSLFTAKSRSKRALLSFIGRFSRNLFGTATVDDVDVLARHINALNRKTQNIEDALVQHGQHLSSFMSQANERKDNLLNGVQENHIAIQYVTAQLQSTANTLQQTFDDMTSLMLQQLRVSNTINHELDELKLAILNLANGKLSPLLIPLSTLQTTLNDVQSILTTNYSGFFVSVKSAAQVYQNAKFIYTRKHATLYLTLKIPISYAQDSLDLYKVLSFPVPVSDSSKHATQVFDLPHYFAVSADQQFYVHMTETQMATCKGSSHKHCHINLPLKPVTKDTCSLGLFANNKAIIQKLCNVRYVPDAIVPSVTELASNKVLLYASPILSMECNGKHQMVHGCNFCIFDLPCQCTLSSENFYLPQRLIACKKSPNNQITKLHPVNLILLQQFFDEKRFQHIFADSTFASPLNVTLPQFKIYDHKMTNILAEDEKKHMNLTKMIEIAKNDEIVFKTLAEPILAGHIDIQSSLLNWNDILSIAAISVSICSSILLALMIIKTRKLAATVLLLQNCKKSVGFSTALPSFIYTHKPEPQENNVFSLDITLSWEHANFALLLINTAILVLMIVKLVRPTKAPKLYLEITSLKQCIFIPIMTLPLCPSLATINLPDSVSDIMLVNSGLFPKLQINWGDFAVHDDFTHTKFKIPSLVRVSFWQQYKLKKLFKQPYFINLHSVHNGYLSPIALSKM